MAESKSMRDALECALDHLLELELFATAISDAAWQEGAANPPAYLFPLQRQIERSKQALTALEEHVRPLLPALVEVSQ